MIKNICVYGASSAHLKSCYYDAAFDLGEKAAQKGWGVVYGGGDTGVMGAAARGVVSKGGKLIGVAPEFMTDWGVLFSGCTELIITKDMRERKKTMEELSDAFIVMPGGFGTLEEYYEILTAKTLGLHSKPIALVNINGIWDGIAAAAHRLKEEMFTNEECVNASRLCGSVDEAISYIQSEGEKPVANREMKYTKLEKNGR